jgi:hypothetical protein
VERREAFASGPLFDTPHFSLVPARGTKSARYISFLASVPDNFGELTDIRLADGEIEISGTGQKDAVRLHASGLREYGL